MPRPALTRSSGWRGWSDGPSIGPVAVSGLGQGPCCECCLRGKLVSSEDLPADTGRWPLFLRVGDQRRVPFCPGGPDAGARRDRRGAHVPRRNRRISARQTCGYRRRPTSRNRPPPRAYRAQRARPGHSASRSVDQPRRRSRSPPRLAPFEARGKAGFRDGDGRSNPAAVAGGHASGLPPDYGTLVCSRSGSRCGRAAAAIEFASPIRLHRPGEKQSRSRRRSAGSVSDEPDASKRAAGSSSQSRPASMGRSCFRSRLGCAGSSLQRESSSCERISAFSGAVRSLYRHEQAGRFGRSHRSGPPRCWFEAERHATTAPRRADPGDTCRPKPSASTRTSRSQALPATRLASRSHSAACATPGSSPGTAYRVRAEMRYAGAVATLDRTVVFAALQAKQPGGVHRSQFSVQRWNPVGGDPDPRARGHRRHRRTRRHASPTRRRPP
jgi:hypothetical protein